MRALRSPCQSVRYDAWQRLHQLDRDAELALAQTFYGDSDPVQRARALWLLSKLSRGGGKYLMSALRCRNPRLRAVAVRAARQSNDDATLAAVLDEVVRDRSPLVRREAAIALHRLESPHKGRWWAEIAQSYDGSDRWLLESLGIGASYDWETCLHAWRAAVGDRWTEQPGRDIVWRSRAADTPDLLVELALHSDVSPSELARTMRAFDFLDVRSERVQGGLRRLLRQLASDPERESIVAWDVLQRLQPTKESWSQEVQAAVERAASVGPHTDYFVPLLAKVRRRFPRG